MISDTRSVTHPGNYTRPIGRILVRQVLRSLKSTNQLEGVGGGLQEYLKLHMALRWPYWCSKSIKWGSIWCTMAWVLFLM